MTYTKERSNCHSATVTIGGDDREGTHYYVCSECNNPCDITVTAPPVEPLSSAEPTEVCDCGKGLPHYKHTAPSLPEADVELDDKLRMKLKALVFDEWEYEDFLKEGLESYVVAIKRDIARLLKELRDKKQTTRVWSGEELSINFVEAIPLSDIDTAISNLERSK